MIVLVCGLNVIVHHLVISGYRFRRTKSGKSLADMTPLLPKKCSVVDRKLFIQNQSTKHQKLNVGLQRSDHIHLRARVF